MVMATKVVDFLKRAKVMHGRVMLTGGTTLNPHILRFIRELAPEIDFVIPKEASYFEAFGAAILARESGTPFPGEAKLLRSNEIRFGRLEDLERRPRQGQVLRGQDGPRASRAASTSSASTGDRPRPRPASSTSRPTRSSPPTTAAPTATR